MRRERCSLEAAVAEAQRLGIAEREVSDDLDALAVLRELQWGSTSRLAIGITPRVEAIALRLEAIASRLEAITS